MFRPMTSAVSALSGFGAYGHQALHHVSFSPSKIPYGGFSPVRLQTGSRPQPSPIAHAIGLYAISIPFSFALGSSQWEQSPLCVGVQAIPSGHSGPEALGSASGCSVPSRHRLLWPHPRLWRPPGGLCSSPTGLCLGEGQALHVAEHQRFPNLSCMSILPCRLPYPGGSDGG